VTEVVGPKGKHDRDRTAKRHGHEDGSMTLGGRRVAVSRPRMRTLDDEHELPVQSYGYFADRDRHLTMGHGAHHRVQKGQHSSHERAAARRRRPGETRRQADHHGQPATTTAARDQHPSAKRFRGNTAGRRRGSHPPRSAHDNHLQTPAAVTPSDLLQDRG
jgi:hypothetical protein